MQKVIKNFFTGNHLKETFDSNSRMIKLLTILYGEIKRTVKAIGCNKKFLQQLLETLKSDFCNPPIVVHNRLYSIFDKAQIKTNDKLDLRQLI